MSESAGNDGWYCPDSDQILLQEPPTTQTTPPDENAVIQHALDHVAGGVWPVWRNTQADKSGDDDTQCVVYLGDTRCPNERGWVVYLGCEHEHIAPSDVCDDHIEKVSSSKFRCQLCYAASGEVFLSQMIKRERAA